MSLTFAPLNSFPTRRSSDLIAIGTALLLVYLIAQFNRPNPVNWSTTLSYNDKIPYGTYSDDHTSELHSRPHLVCRILNAKKNVFTNGNLTGGSYINIGQNAT